MRIRESSYKCSESPRPSSEVNPAPALTFYFRHIACQPCRIFERPAVTCGTRTQNVGLRLGQPADLGSVEQSGHLGWRQVILGALVPVGGRDGAEWPTLDLLPLGRRRRHRRNPLLVQE